MQIAFYGGQTAGIVVLLTILAKNHKISFIIPQDNTIRELAVFFKLNILEKENLENPDTISLIKKKSDLFICCHGRKIFSKRFVQNIRCINLHPCLYKYKGANPIARLIKDNNPKASVAAHWMTENIDEGKTIIEKFKKIQSISSKSESEIYDELYPLYSKVLTETLMKLKSPHF